jgi:hypothetical protein
MNRRVKILSLATYLTVGTYLSQLGGCFTIGANTAVASFPFSSLLDENELFLGVFAPCGTPNIVLVNEDGTSQGEVLNSEDDLIFFCPVTPVLQGTGGGGGG